MGDGRFTERDRAQAAPDRLSRSRAGIRAGVRRRADDAMADGRARRHRGPLHALLRPRPRGRPRPGSRRGRRSRKGERGLVPSRRARDRRRTTVEQAGDQRADWTTGTAPTRSSGDWVKSRTPDEPLWQLDSIAVDPAAQGQGFGAALIGLGLARARSGRSRCGFPDRHTTQRHHLRRSGFLRRRGCRQRRAAGPHIWSGALGPCNAPPAKRLRSRVVRSFRAGAGPDGGPAPAREAVAAD